MSGFDDYLWSLLTRPFKVSDDPTGAQNYTKVVGAALDDAKAAMFLMRRAWYIQTAPVAALPIIGDGLRMPQFLNESDEEYRNRLIGAFDWYYWMGTKKGILNAISYITSVTCLITEYQVDCWRLGVARLGQDTILMNSALMYIFELYFTAELDAETEARVRAIVDVVKPAHTQYVLRYPTTAEEQIWVLNESKLGYETIVTAEVYGLTEIAGAIYVIRSIYPNIYIDDAGNVFYDSETSNATLTIDADNRIFAGK
jgi:hypothetical protein